MNKTFYYRFNPLNAWLIFNCALAITFIWGLFHCPCLLYWMQTQILLGVLVFSFLAWGWKYLIKHKMAVVTDEDITIDHCAPLKWTDIKFAEEKFARCGWCKYKIIALVPKEGIDYKYNFLQKHNGEFTAFSIPLYNIITKEDAEEIRKIIENKVTLKKMN